MQISIRYASRRGEVWRFYWQMWRRSLWRVHLVIFLLAALAASSLLYDGAPHGLAAILSVLAIGLVPLIGLVMWPMVMFKPQERTLLVNRDGLHTRIGHISATVPWQDVAELRADGDYLVIEGRGRNAFLVPDRAFQTAEAKSQFREFVAAMKRFEAA